MGPQDRYRAPCYRGVFVIAANIFIRTDLFTQLINKKPEKDYISWESAVTYLPGVATAKGFTLRSQTKRDQVYVHLAEANARISLIKIILSKPRMWFDEQQKPPPEKDQAAAADTR